MVMFRQNGGRKERITDENIDLLVEPLQTFAAYNICIQGSLGKLQGQGVHTLEDLYRGGS